VLDRSEKLSSRGGAPNLESMDTELTPTGVRYCKLRQLPNGDRYIRTAEFVMPNSIAVPAVQENGLGYLVNWHVPIDDTHHWKYMFQFNWERPIDAEGQRADRYAYMTPDYRSTRNQANRYRQDRQEMVSESYTGMGYEFNVHDLWAVESQGPVQDRTQEHLAPSDIALAHGRHMVLDWIRRVQAGESPPQFEPDPALGRPKRPVSVYGTIPASTHWADYCRERE
jgi:phthalate 4,5-dioxygenase